MKRILAVVFAVAIVSLGAIANAQTPNVSIYFDDNASQTTADCPAAPVGTVIDSFLVVANNFNMWMNGIEYAIDYPPQIGFLADIIPAGRLSIGSTPIGIGITFPIPGSAFGAFVIQKVYFIWMCDGCDGNQNAPIAVVPYPSSGLVRAVRWPDLAVVPGVGMTSLICATVPAEETTWGKVKALYE